MKLHFIKKEQDKAYIANALWLPKTGIRAEPFKKALEFSVKGQGGLLTNFAMWEETTNHIVCPREFLGPQDYTHYKFPFVDLRPKFQRVRFQDLVTPRDEEQEAAWGALSKNDNGILNLACGKGKTKLALKKIAQKNVPTLVIVPDGGILSQWKESIYGNGGSLKPGLKFDGELGLIQGPVFNWAKPITLALVTTLALRIRDGVVPEELFRYFGLIIYDEVHQIGAPMFSLTAAPFYGDRIGLTATVRREDGLDPIYRFHIGEPFYTDLSQELTPRIYFQQTPNKINYDKAKINGTTNISVLRSTLGIDFQSNVYRYWCIRQALAEGRKILCLSHSKNQLRLFHKMFPGSGLIISETEKDERMKVLRDSQICFAISKLGSTGIDDDALDTLFWLTPFRSRISLQQSMGRILRLLKGKKTPVMIVFEDWVTPALRQLCRNLKSSLKEWGYAFDTIKVQNFSQQLPPEVQKLYDAQYSELEP